MPSSATRLAVFSSPAAQPPFTSGVGGSRSASYVLGGGGASGGFVLPHRGGGGGAAGVVGHRGAWKLVDDELAVEETRTVTIVPGSTGADDVDNGRGRPSVPSIVVVDGDELCANSCP